MCWSPCGVPGALGYSIPPSGAAGWPEHPWVLPEHHSRGWRGGSERGRRRGDGGKPAHVAQLLLLSCRPARCPAAAVHEHTPSDSLPGRKKKPSSCAASQHPLSSLGQLTKAICYTDADSPVVPPVHLSHSPALKGRGWFQEINAAFGELHLPGWSQPRRCAAPLGQGCSLQGRARPAKPVQMPTAGPLNCLAPKGRNSIFLFCEFSQRIHLTDSSAFPA